MRVALVHDYLYVYGGAERVLEALHEIWPASPIYTAWVDWSWLKKQKKDWLKWKIITSWFDKIPFKEILCSPLRFSAPKIWSSFDLSKFDVVISSSAWYMSKGVSLGARGPLHFCYCHTPPRYLYGYETSINFQKYWWGRLYANIINPFMRYYDFKSSQSVNLFICNSREVQQRIRKFYRREAEIIYPPVLVSTKHQAPSIKHQNTKYFLMVNRLVEPKNVDLGIKACRKLKINLKIVGTGPDEKRLKKIADNSSYIEFLGYVDDNNLAQLYTNCEAVLYLAKDEDFGITPVEAMSFGKGVIALRSGGVVESIIDKKTGILTDELRIEAIIKAIKQLSNLTIKKEDCIKQAEKFNKERFKKQIKAFVEEKYQKHYIR